MSVLEQPHPPPIAQQDVIQQAVNATKRSWTLLPVLRVVQLRAGCVQPLVCNTVVPREHLEMDSEIHSSSLHLTLVRPYLRQTGSWYFERSYGPRYFRPLSKLMRREAFAPTPGNSRARVTSDRDLTFLPWTQLSRRKCRQTGQGCCNRAGQYDSQIGYLANKRVTKIRIGGGDFLTPGKTPLNLG